MSMKKILTLVALTLIVVLTFAGCDNKEQEVSCSMCNGSGEVKYYFGDGDNDYNMGVCTSCDGKGVVTVVPSGNSFGGKEICPSCEKYVKELITKEDAAGENRTWCADCWEEYDDIMGR